MIAKPKEYVPVELIDKVRITVNDGSDGFTMLDGTFLESGRNHQFTMADVETRFGGLKRLRGVANLAVEFFCEGRNVFPPKSTRPDPPESFRVIPAVFRESDK